MAGYPVLTKEKEQKMIGWVSFMYKAGKTHEHMAAALKQPIARIQSWIELVKETEAKNN